MCRQRLYHQQSDKTAVKHIDTEEQPPDYFQSEYTTPYFITNEQAKAPISVSRLQPKSTTFRTKIQSTSDLYGYHSLGDPQSLKPTVK